MNGRLLAWTGLLLTVAAPALADTVVLKNGRVLTGRVVSDENDTLVLEVADGKDGDCEGEGLHAGRIATMQGIGKIPEAHIPKSRCGALML